MQSAGLHLSKNLISFIKSIGDSRSKQEEDRIVLEEFGKLKVNIKESGVKSKIMKENLLRAIYIEMLGHNVGFSHFYAVNLTQDKNLLNKRVGYLACNLLLHEDSDALMMLCASLQKDIQSKNWLEVSMSLQSIVKFANPIIIQAVLEPVKILLDSSSDQIRKKAVICLLKFEKVMPGCVTDIDLKMKRMLCDADPSVMACSLNFYLNKVKSNPEPYKTLTSTFVVILKQIIEHKLPKEYDYHRIPAPWIQLKLLEILSYLGKDDKENSENLYEVISTCLKRADETGNIGLTMVYQCLITVCTIYPNDYLLELAANNISRFLNSQSANLKCTGIKGLSLIIEINSEFVFTHQKVIVDCLEDNDETLKKSTFELLYKMTSPGNIEIIISKMINYLKNTSQESSFKKDILIKITELTESFAPSRKWYVNTINRILIEFSELISETFISKVIRLFGEWEGECDREEFTELTLDTYCSAVNKYSYLSESIIKIIAWVLGEFGKVYCESLNRRRREHREMHRNFEVYFRKVY